ncbi:DUF4286 family protein [Pseudoxanthomonas sp. z9]|uniref:DUF4286 family protein n=1 Tax=Pseudoxanthomonas sp. z9 TaxID=2584942 RepID=UPI0015E891CB|nr:DUF4286 family protein [Pseudoxanthomonas sp. z9]
MTIIYEVDLAIDVDIAEAHARWLDAHVREMLGFAGFLEAEILDRRDPPAESGWVARCVRYRLADHASLDAYLRDHAPRMRAEGIARFGEQVRASRRILAVAARY